MALVPVVRLVKGGDAAVVNVGSSEETDLRARGYAEEGAESPKKSAPVRPKKAEPSGGGEAA